ncbi:MAG: T9SS type A sorting domain-containing protein [Bacteroidetes bacterium]|nr:T9SS type A sorting domain-containing protein [Bacteroidota bacterium]
MAKLGQAYPNPANGNVFIPITNAFANSSIQVTDITGRVVLTQSTNGQTTVELNVAALNAGYYTYRIVSGNNATNALPLEIVK